MPYQLAPFAPVELDEDLLRFLIDEQESEATPRYNRLWRYYRNESVPVDVHDAYGSRHIWRSAQAEGLPPRLTSSRTDAAPREIVIENDIGWRIETLTDYVAGRGMTIRSFAKDVNRRAIINAIARAVLDHAGGIAFVQDLALLGSIYGHVDVLVRTGDLFASLPMKTNGARERPADVPSETKDLREIIRAALKVRLETVEAPRAVPLLHPADYESIDAYILHYRRWTNDVSESGFLSRVGSWMGGLGSSAARERATAEVTEIITKDHLQLYEDEELIGESVNPLGVIPIVHIQNLAQPYFYEGLSDVESLIPLQDELNTRLSDRANRVTLQSFKMYLGKGIEGFGERPISPGQMWMTDNPEASIEAFGGDAASPSEEAHIEEIRDAMDRASSVSPLAAGLIRTRVGTLSSENALRISLLGILSKTERKRRLYGRGLSRLFEIVLMALDRAGVFHTEPEDRRIEIEWEAAIPETEHERLTNALLKRDLGVAPETILAELGYDAAPTRQNHNQTEES